MENKELNKKFKYYSGKKYDGFMGRCYRPKDHNYKNYGKRGIRVTGDWIKSIQAFRQWLREELAAQGISILDFVKESKKYQLDRIDVNGHYTPENCRIVSVQANARNKRNAVLVAVESAEGECIQLKNNKESKK